MIRVPKKAEIQETCDRLKKENFRLVDKVNEIQNELDQTTKRCLMAENSITRLSLECAESRGQNMVLHRMIDRLFPAKPEVFTLRDTDAKPTR